MRYMVSKLQLFCVLLVCAFPSLIFGKSPDLNWSVQQLKKNNFDLTFIKIVQKHYDKKSFQQVIRLNTLGFLSPANHMSLISDLALKKSLNFLDKNQETFLNVQKDYDVPSEIISSLLWVETQHGNITGTFHVPSVYLHLLQLSRQKNRAYLFEVARKNPASREIDDKELTRRIKERADRRAKWALEELRALERIHITKQKDIKNLKGSFAGAFGLPQFIPSSYLAFASSNAKRSPNLFSIEDSIKSVARYLMIHGWSNSSEDQQVEALMKYNNSRDYAKSIIELAKRIKKIIDENKNRSIAGDVMGES